MKTRFKKLAALVVILIAAVGAAYWLFVGSRHKVRNVILISIDTCRADHLSCYGFGKKTTPNIDALAAQGILFENAYTPVPLTLPAHCSMLTGTYPIFHSVHNNLGHRMAESSVTIAEMLKPAGYKTGAVVSTFVLDTQFGLDQGFDYYNGRFEKSVGPREDKERRGEEASRFACTYIEENRDKPFFLFLHYYDPHTDYEPPEPFASTWADDLYSGEIAYVDHCIAKVTEKLKILRLYDSTLLVIVGDHGEGLGEHGEAEHGYYVYQNAVKVPFIIHPPGGVRGRRIGDVVSLVDVVPTILAYLNMPVPPVVQGKDLSGYCKDRAMSEPDRHLYCEAMMATTYGCNPLLAVINRQWKFIDTTKPEMYDLRIDTAEANNLAVAEDKRARLMRSGLQELVTEYARGKVANSEMKLDDESIKRLESLGYVGGGSTDVGLQMDPAKPDPKDLIAYHENNQRVVYLIYHARLDEAKAICQKMLVEWPQMVNTYFSLGRVTFEKEEYQESVVYNTKYLALVEDSSGQQKQTLGVDSAKPTYMAHNLLAGAYYKLGQYQKAADQYRTMLSVRTGQPDAFSNLAACEFALGRFDAAIKYWNDALRLNPGAPDVHNNIASAYYKKEQFDLAMEHWQKALQLKPDLADARRNLTLLEEQKKQQGKIAEYRKSLESKPDDANLYDAIAKIYYQQGKVEQAVEHWSKAVSLRPEDAQIQNALATALYSRKDYPRAIEHWSEAVRLDPNWAEVHNNLAWILATVGDEKLRDANRALQLAERACELTGNNQPGLLDTLGVAYAAAGKFDEAIKAAEKAIKLARDNKQDKVADDIGARLELYKANKPYRE